MRNFKALGPMAIAVTAMSILLVPAAQAEPDGEFTAGLTSPLTHTSTFLHGEVYGGPSEKLLQNACC